MAIDVTTQGEMVGLVNEINGLSRILVDDAKNTTSELEASTISKINKVLQDMCDYLDSLVPEPLT